MFPKYLHILWLTRQQMKEQLNYFTFSRPLLFQTSQHISTGPAVGDIIPYSTVLLFLFSRAPPEMKAPHEVYNAYMTMCYTLWFN